MRVACTRLMPGSLFGHAAVLNLFAEAIDGDGDDDGGADDVHGVFLADGQGPWAQVKFLVGEDGDAVVDHLDDEGSQDGSERGSATAAEARAADDRGGDDGQFITEASV